MKKKIQRKYSLEYSFQKSFLTQINEKTIVCYMIINDIILKTCNSSLIEPIFDVKVETCLEFKSNNPELKDEKLKMFVIIFKLKK